MEILKIISDFMAFVLTTGGIYLLSRNDKYSKWGAVIGLAAQPFWFILAVLTESPGIFLTAVVLTAFYLNGIRNFFKR